MSSPPPSPPSIVPPSSLPHLSSVSSSSRLSLLDVVISEYQSESPNRCSRLLLCALSESNRLAEFHQSFISSRPSDVQPPITGLFFHINQSSMTVLLECSTACILDYLKQLASSGVSQAKILSFNEECPREFGVWCSRIIRIPVDEEFQNQKDLIRFTFETLRNLLELGREAAALSGSEEKQLDFLLNSQSKQLIQRVPTAERIAGYMTCEELFDIESFLESFDAPVEFELESEKVWPIEPALAIQPTNPK
jgi:hypothetical protein